MKRGKRKTRLGQVVSDKMDKTVVVAVETRRRHPRYGRIITYRTKFKAHDEDNACRVGDLVRIAETRPLSKDKRWRVAEILTRREIIEVPPLEEAEEAEIPLTEPPEEAEAPEEPPEGQET